MKHDANSNVTGLIATDGTVDEHDSHDPYGEPVVWDGSYSSTAGSSSFDWDYLFQGMQHDSTLHQSTADHRAYDSVLGRWIQQDPAGYVDGPNTYQFVESNPVGSTDSLGLADIPSGIFGDIWRQQHFLRSMRDPGYLSRKTFFGTWIVQYGEGGGFSHRLNSGMHINVKFIPDRSNLTCGDIEGVQVMHVGTFDHVMAPQKDWTPDGWDTRSPSGFAVDASAIGRIWTGNVGSTGGFDSAATPYTFTDIPASPGHTKLKWDFELVIINRLSGEVLGSLSWGYLVGANGRTETNDIYVNEPSETASDGFFEAVRSWGLFYGPTEADPIHNRGS